MLTSSISLRLNVPARSSIQRRRRTVLRIEQLESRTLLSAYWPSQIRSAYGFSQLPYGGSGITIAIVDAYDDPNIASDLSVFDGHLGIPAPPSLIKATPQGQPAANRGWAQEIALDVEWAHAIAPAANILLVEAKDTTFTNLLAAVDYAANNAQVVSMSWGGSEFSGETSYDFHFARSGVTFVAASGDNGGTPEWPATSPHVLAVGGTTLGSVETGWSSSGGGLSQYENKPSFQSTERFVHARANPDVAYDADPSTGVWIYDSYGSGGWAVLGGTSVGTPQWAALVALADQGRGSPLTGDTQVLTALYQLYGSSSYTSYFNDIQSGSNGFTAGVGYDLVTGLGSPRANNLVPYLVGYSGLAAPVSKNSGSRVVANSATVVSNAQPLTVLPAPTSAHPDFLNGVASSSPTTVNGASVIFVPTPSGSAGAAPASFRSVLSRIESGGGDNAALQDDEEPDQGPILPMDKSDAAPSRMVPAPMEPASEGQPISGPRQASDACFADPSWTPNQPIEAGHVRASMMTDLPLDGTSGGALLAAFLGCYWRAQLKDAERRGSRQLLN